MISETKLSASETPVTFLLTHLLTQAHMGALAKEQILDVSK